MENRMKYRNSTIKEHPVVSREVWLSARKELLIKEKELTRLYDQLRKERMALPWVKMYKSYIFDGPGGKVSLEDLFDGRSQLIVQHFMFAPGWEEGCVGCSFGADHAEAARIHLENHDVTYVAVSRATYPEIEAYKNRMGWKFNWVSSYNNDFNYDFHVSFPKEKNLGNQVFYNYDMRDYNGEEASGTSVFYKDEAGNVYHTYSAYARGDEQGLGTYMLLDLTPKGRNENGPHFSLMDWVLHHDKYERQSGALEKDTSCCH
jgi:predicted dithiol-disulfide oxidoreductase (DUF899 family)